MSHRSALLVSWFCVQILTLAVGAMRLPLSARAGTQPQSLALPEMVVVQVALATLLFPVLFGKGAGFAAALSALPFLQLAGFLTATPMGRVGAIGLAITIWFAGLWTWVTVLAEERAQLIGVAVLGALVIGVPLARYLVTEFADSDQTLKEASSVVDPLACLLRTSTRDAIDPAAFVAPGFLLLSGAIILGLRKKNTSRQVIHKLFHRSVVVESGKPAQ